MTITKLGRYDIVRVLGKGAMGLVYEARDPNLDRRVAIKTIKVENLSAEASADYEARFRTEARSAARLQHPNIVSVYDSERHGDTAYLVMEYVQGDDLKQHLDGGKRYTLDESLGMVRDLLAALDYAHRQNIVHRDVKPANLLVEASGRVKLTDFGVARIQDSGEATRTKGSMVGTLKYMSPEQVQGLSVDSRADLFAAGIVLYQLLTGRRPFDGEGEFAIIHQIVSQDPPPPSSINPQLPPALDAVVARALAKQRDDRYASAHEFALALQEASGQVPDPTIVPPFSSSEFRGTGGTGSGVQRSRTGTGSGSTARAGDGSGTTVTQELELVYWKDIKDTDDPADLRGFLDRFPEGIYADLARRRLRKLDGDTGDTSMTRTRVTPPAAADAAAHEATALVPRPDDATLVTPRAAAPEAAEPVPPDAADEATLVAAVPGEPVQAPSQEQRAPTEPAAAPPDVARQAPPAPPAVVGASSAPPSGPARKSRLVPVLAGLVVAAGAVWMLLPGRTPPATEAASPTSAASAPAEAAATPAQASAASEPPVSTVPAAGAVAVRAPAGAASAAAPARSKGATPAKGAASVPLTSSPAAPAATPAPVTAPPPPPAPAPATAQRPPAARPASESKPADAGSPAVACEGRTLFSLQTCMNEQCAKPAFARHPVCVERAAADRAARGKQGADNR
ncbi:MAG: serine/threonine-protein kinase [Rhodoferax sp.]